MKQVEAESWIIKPADSKKSY